MRVRFELSRRSPYEIVAELDLDALPRVGDYVGIGDEVDGYVKYVHWYPTLVPPLAVVKLTNP